MAVAVLQVECKWLQLAGTGVDHVIYSPINNNCLFVIAVYQQCCNPSGLHQTWNYRLWVWRKLEKEEGMICKISWSYTYNKFSWGQFCIYYLLYESSNIPFEPLGTTSLSCLPLKSFSLCCSGLMYKATPHITTLNSRSVNVCLWMEARGGPALPWGSAGWTLMNVAVVIPGIPAWSAGSSQHQRTFTLPGNSQVRDEFCARAWGLVRGSRRLGTAYEEEVRGSWGIPACTPQPGGCWRHLPATLPLKRASLMDMPFFPGHSLQPAALTCSLLTRAYSTQHGPFVFQVLFGLW